MSVEMNPVSVDDVAQIMFFHIKVEAYKAKQGSFPSHALVVSAIVMGLKDLAQFSQDYPINVTNREAVKVFAFAIPHLLKSIDSVKIKGDFQLEDYIVYKACLGFLNTVYEEVDLTKMPDLVNTCRILVDLCRTEQSLASYAYIKGVHEACIAFEA